MSPGQALELVLPTSGLGFRIDGGILQIEHGVELEITADTMPEGTGEGSVTLEPEGGSTEPSGPLVLHGDEVMRIL